MNIEEFDETARSEQFINHWKKLNDSKLCWQIEISPFLSNHDFHYEWRNNRVEIHIEGSDWRPLRQIFYDNWETLKAQGLGSGHWWRNDCQYFLENPNPSENQLIRLEELIRPFIEKYIDDKNLRPKHMDREKPKNTLFDEEDETVVLFNDVTLKELFDNYLFIPDYQRIYCWKRENVTKLFSDITENSGGEYHLGGIILYKNKEKKGFDIVDGQQRLVTLTLLLGALGYKGCLPLIEERFLSNEAKEHIAYNKKLCQMFASKQLSSINLLQEDLCNKLLKNLMFSVVVITSQKFELAYTFFSNENSKGKALDDFNLLKAHHLRYIDREPQQEHLATRWDRFTSSNEYGEIPEVKHALGQYILRLRKWMQGEVVPQTKYVVRNEYVAAPVLDDVPGFGEQFQFNETIQGGAHFFTYSEKMTDQYHSYISTTEHSVLVENLYGESHYYYAEMIDTLLFGYYLKFGRQYLAEALFVIERTISAHRYANNRARKDKIMEFVTKSHIIMKIDRATSPSFFIADLMQYDYIEPELQGKGIRERYRECIKSLYKQLESKITVKSISNNIKSFLNYEEK